ncbi:hypothetical protein RUM43_001270 [Polyplax serrata]|uniref:Scavenger receptor class B member 1 n=1 Tax=Polyplax serrata TaxID=468196 RepID=A0AAN8XPZ0_POLSC
MGDITRRTDRERKLVVIVLGLFTLALGILLSSIPWLDYLILKHLRLANGTLSFQYWQRPGVIRLTKVYIFNVTNPDGFLNNNEKPKLVEVGPFVYREDMEKVNIKFYNNGTVSFQQNKILRYVPEWSSGNKEDKVIVPNIPLLTLATFTKDLQLFLRTALSIFLGTMDLKPFVSVTPEELVFGYDDVLTNLAHKYFPRHKRPNKKMGLLLGRNGTLKEVSTIFTGHTSMQDFGLINRINGLDHLPYWSQSPCNSIRASEGSFFPPRDFTKSDIVHVYDKDLCRILPLKYRGDVSKFGVTAGLYTPSEDALETAQKNVDNKCYCPDVGSYCPPKGLQNINPCHFEAPVFLSYPHFLQADPSLLDAVEGLKPDVEKHQTVFKIQNKLGVPLEGLVRVQMNLKISKVSNIKVVAKFPDIIFPIMWIEEGVEELTPPIKRWLYIATTFSDVAVPVFTYGCICIGSSILLYVFVNAYKNLLFADPRIELGKERLTRELREIRRGSSVLVNSQPRLLILRDSYTLLDNLTGDSDHGKLDRRIPEV